MISWAALFKESLHKYDLIILATGIPLTVVLSFMVHNYLLIPLAFNYRWSETQRQVITVIFGCTAFLVWRFISRNEIVRIASDIEQEMEYKIKYGMDKSYQSLTDEEFKKEFEAIEQLIKDHMANRNFQDARTMWNEADSMLSKSSMPDKSGYIKRLGALEERINAGLAVTEGR